MLKEDRSINERLLPDYKFQIELKDINKDKALIEVNGEQKTLKEGEINQFGEIYIHLLRINFDKARFAAGTELGKCTEGCRCIPKKKEQPTCGNKIIEGEEQCDPPGEACRARSGLSSVCNNDCTCPEPLTGFTYCGDGTVQKPNSMGLIEMCEKPGMQCVTGGKIGTCTQNCQCKLPGIIPAGKCGDKNIDVNAGEECDPPGTGCIKNRELGRCNSACKCDVLNLGPEDLMKLKDLKQIICGREPECWPANSDCEKDGKEGKCNDRCECKIIEEKGDINAKPEMFENCRTCKTCTLTYAQAETDEIAKYLNSILTTQDENVKDLIRLMLIMLPKLNIESNHTKIISYETETCELNKELKGYLTALNKFIKSIISYIETNMLKETGQTQDTAPAGTIVEEGEKQNIEINTEAITSFKNFKAKLESLSAKITQKLNKIETTCNMMICEREKDGEWVRTDCSKCKTILQYT
ncbi:hypothetical protein DRJ25_03640 [Candidatus Woesearchaeota archaeon]|nr:MAG: hypothetical protein DRJ25_03640 [Candidatus Woesearchaeota archaeon]